MAASASSGKKLTITEDIKREVGQHFVFGFHGYEPSDDIKTLIQEYHVGNIILFKRNIQSAAQTRGLVKDLQRLAKESGHTRPLLVGIDQENGLVSAFSSPRAGTTFPGAMATSATGSLELAEAISKASGTELRMVGINWVYGPVADVNSDSRNPVIGVRSFGDDPQMVASYASAVTRGHLASGIASTAKHFPGHGDTYVDSHLALPVIRKSKEQISKEELVPFKALIDAGVSIPSVITGHMALPLITGDDTPCSLSRTITTDLLKNELGYKGLVVTDCLEMDAIAEPLQGGCGVREGAVRALEAGADVVMICHTFERQREAVEGVYEALGLGRISVEELMENRGRVERMKEVFCGSWKEIGEEGEGEKEWKKRFDEVQEGNRELSRKAYLRSTTVVWNANDIIPLDAAKIGGLLLFTPAVESVNKAVDPGESESEGVLKGPGGLVRNTAGPSYLAFARALEGRVGEGKIVHCVYGAGDDLPKFEAMKDAGAIVFVMRNADQRKWQLEYLGGLRDQIQQKGIKAPVVLVSSCGPYDLGNSEGKKYRDWTAYVATYEFTAEAFGAAVQVVFGKQEDALTGKGKLPVSVDLI